MQIAKIDNQTTINISIPDIKKTKHNNGYNSLLVKAYLKNYRQSLFFVDLKI